MLDMKCVFLSNYDLSEADEKRPRLREVAQTELDGGLAMKLFAIISAKRG